LWIVSLKPVHGAFVLKLVDAKDVVVEAVLVVVAHQLFSK
jgi:hypothetical protein